MQLIQKVFHQIWVGPDPLPATAEDYAASWREHHPDWDMELWTDQNLPQGQINLDIYRQTDKPSQRADILAHELLNQYGGVYIDIDYECLRNIEPLLDGVSYFYGEELPERPALGILGCVAGHPFSRLCQLKIRELWPWRPGQILQETGPDFYQRAIRSYLGEHAQSPHADPLSHRQAGARLEPSCGLPLHMFEPWILYPYYLGESWEPQDHPDAYAVHHWQKNWEF
jgi:mannosyltransferase OCH1-like enzyme